MVVEEMKEKTAQQKDKDASGRGAIANEEKKRARHLY